MEMNDILKDQKTLIAIGVGLIIVVAIVALVFMGGKPGSTPTKPNSGSQKTVTGTETETGTTNNGNNLQKVEVKTEVINDKVAAIENKKLVVDFNDYKVYITSCIKNGNYVLAKVAYFPIVKFDAILYDIKNNKVLFVKDKKVYETNAKLIGDVNSCKTTTEDLTKGLDLTKVNPVEDLMFA